MDEVCNGNINDYFDDSDDVLKIARIIRKRMSASGDDPDMLLKVKFFILTNKELDTRLLSANLLETTIRKSKGRTKKAKTTKKIKKADYKEKPLEIRITIHKKTVSSVCFIKHYFINRLRIITYIRFF